ncbi:MAG: helix-turn-helix domain-containing protein [Halodesulfurarchaeum sp.]
MTRVCGSAEARSREGSTTSKRPLCAVLEIDMDGECPLAQVNESARDIYVRQVDGLCRADVVVESDELEVHHVEKAIDEECVGSIFGRYDCVPHITEAKGGSLTIMTFPPQRTMLSNLVSDMREQSFDVKVKRLISLEDYDETGRDTPLLCDVSILTEKEREAVDLAVSEGYYDEATNTTLEDLAGEIGISKSALSTRLSSAESKLMTELFTRMGDGN